ncbi:hypothetical protein HEK616_72270 [Streptomyces nigrescens]|uniref:Uncharacterized protein n=1 Tax=Streptomyces nigrescens TaxID=1920 RepID=A0ABN6R826_STRNI|nr:hypothetical protein HEK616_72270 [Streptomyces nigrescens]
MPRADRRDEPARPGPASVPTAQHPSRSGRVEVVDPVRAAPAPFSGDIRARPARLRLVERLVTP